MNDINLKNPEYYYNRELSWLKFNLRVLKETTVEETPLLERLKFISIAASNLDEFFMVRVASLWNALDSGVEKRDAAGMTPEEQLTAISEAAHEQMKTMYKYLNRLREELEKEGLLFKEINQLSDAGQEYIREIYKERIEPVLTPMVVDVSHPFPHSTLANKTQNICAELINSEGEKVFIIVRVPPILDRIIEVGTEAGTNKKHTFVWLEDIIATYAKELFQGYELLDTVYFRVTRDSDFELDEEEMKDFMKEMEESLRKRKRGDVVRLEVKKTSNSAILNFLMDNMKIDEDEIYEINGPLDCTCFFKFPGMKHRPDLLHDPFCPQLPQELQEDEDLFAAIEKRDILLHHPYESFDPVVKFVSDAADDPNVTAIKQTLYRVSGNSPIVAALARAAENGKEVTVLVELKARFDEENNINWAKRLEKAGCHVIWGIKGLKTHAKIILIVRNTVNGIKRYLHLGTGNYNDSTAKLYTDMGLMTANDQFGMEASAFFNYLSAKIDPPFFSKLSMAPLTLREKIYNLIDREIANVRAGKEGHIIAKMNSLIDQPVIQRLYKASMAGVKIELIVRGICGVKVGIPDISENITVRSIIGRQLEHSRVFWFANGGEEQLYMSSADWMPRNLNDRVELFFPVETEAHIKRIKAILDLYLRDNVGAHMMQTNGNYRRVRNKLELVSAQNELYKEALQRAASTNDPSEHRLQPIFSHK